MPRRSSTGSASVTSLPSRKIRPRRRLDQPVDHLQRRRLAAAGRTDQADHLAARDVEVELLHRDRAVGVGLADALEPDHRLFGNVHAVTLLGSVHGRDPTRAGRAPPAPPSRSCYSRLTNDWICGEYFADRQDELVAATVAAPRDHRRRGAARARARLPAGAARPPLPQARGDGARLQHRHLHDPVAGAVPAAGAVHRPQPTTVVIGLALYSLTILVRSIARRAARVPDDVRRVRDRPGLRARPGCCCGSSCRWRCR